MNVASDIRALPDARAYGGKAASLAGLERAGLTVPEWRAIAPDTLASLLAPVDRRALEAARSPREIRRILERADVDAAADATLRAVHRTLAGVGGRIAVRSSALDEDGARHSFAGQLESHLGVSDADVARRVLDVWRSAYSARVHAYRRHLGVAGLPAAPGVILQRMVCADAAGVAFSADPVSGRRGIAVVTAVRGLAPALVSGTCDADTWRVDRAGRIVDRSMALDPGAATAHAARPVLDDTVVTRLAALARAAQGYFGRPQDVEFALEDGRIHVLQSRPVTGLTALPDPDGTPALWDNSNIVESYRGVTTALTYSFARRAYGEVYRRLARLLGVPVAVAEQRSDAFRRLIGFIHGRIYYNLDAWYELLALAPGFSANRRFMERMMGVRRSRGQGASDAIRRRVRSDGMHGLLALAATGAGLVAHFVRLDRHLVRFHRRVEALLAPPPTPFALMRPEELVAHYRGFERAIFADWNAPLLNDVFTMVFHGVLERLTAQWLGDGGAGLHGALLTRQPDMVSSEPARLMHALAALAARDPALTALLCDGPAGDIERAMTRVAGFEPGYRAYLARFGDRCLEELKLESATLADDPLPLLRGIGELARHTGHACPPAAASAQDARRDAEHEAMTRLSGRPIRRALFRFVLRHARRCIRNRENLRFERTRAFGHVRRVLLEIGQRLYAIDVLDDPRAVFHLEVEEILGYVDGTCTSARLRDLSRIRREEFEHNLAHAPLPDRFVTLGSVRPHPGVADTAPATRNPEGDVRSGLGCSPGIVRGRVRVVSDPRRASLRPGEIIVAESTDPGWVMLFPRAAGLLVERGSLLSHSAIVARELGLPAVVSVPKLRCWLRDGDEVELDGARGTVRRIATAPRVAA